MNTSCSVDEDTAHLRARTATRSTDHLAAPVHAGIGGRVTGRLLVHCGGVAGGGQTAANLIDDHRVEAVVIALRDGQGGEVQSGEEKGEEKELCGGHFE